MADDSPFPTDLYRKAADGSQDSWIIMSNLARYPKRPMSPNSNPLISPHKARTLNTRHSPSRDAARAGRHPLAPERLEALFQAERASKGQGVAENPLMNSFRPRVPPSLPPFIHLATIADGGRSVRNLPGYRQRSHIHPQQVPSHQGVAQQGTEVHGTYDVPCCDGCDAHRYESRREGEIPRDWFREPQLGPTSQHQQVPSQQAAHSRGFESVFPAALAPPSRPLEAAPSGYLPAQSSWPPSNVNEREYPSDNHEWPLCDGLPAINPENHSLTTQLGTSGHGRPCSPNVLPLGNTSQSTTSMLEPRPPPSPRGFVPLSPSLYQSNPGEYPPLSSGPFNKRPDSDLEGPIYVSVEDRDEIIVTKPRPDVIELSDGDDAVIQVVELSSATATPESPSDSMSPPTTNPPPPRVSLETLWDSRLTLNRDAWLNDEIVACFVRRIGRSAGLAHIDSLALEAKRTPRLKRRLAKVIQGRRAVLLPVCNRDANHWTLYVLSTEEGLNRLHHYDSLRPDQSYERVWLKERKMVRELFAWICDDPNIEEEAVNHVKCDQQLNYSDCGVFVICNAARVAADLQDASATGVGETSTSPRSRSINVDHLVRQSLRDAIFSSQPATDAKAQDVLRTCAPHELDPRTALRRMQLVAREEIGKEEPSAFMRDEDNLYVARARVGGNAQAMRSFHDMHERAIGAALHADATLVASREQVREIPTFPEKLADALAKEASGRDDGRVKREAESKKVQDAYGRSVAMMLILRKAAQKQKVDRERLHQLEIKRGRVVR